MHIVANSMSKFVEHLMSDDQTTFRIFCQAANVMAGHFGNTQRFSFGRIDNKQFTRKRIGDYEFVFAFDGKQVSRRDFEIEHPVDGWL